MAGPGCGAADDGLLPDRLHRPGIGTAGPAGNGAGEGEALSLPWTVGLNQWDSVAYDREDVLVSLMKDQTAAAVPQLPEGTTLELDLAQRVPDEAVLMVLVLNEDGSVLEEGEAQTETPEAAETGSRLTIEVQRPDGQDAQSGELLLGYRLRCRWQENSCEYGWVLRV